MTRTTKAALLLSSFILCASAIFATNRLRERTPDPAPRDLYSVVNDQLSAFRADDFRSAYRYAASRVQQKFTPEQFEAMIRANYPEMARASRVEFGSIQVRDASASVQAFFFASNGSVRSFLFSLLSEKDSWRIGGVEEVGAPTVPRRLRGTHA